MYRRNVGGGTFIVALIITLVANAAIFIGALLAIKWVFGL